MCMSSFDPCRNGTDLVGRKGPLPLCMSSFEPCRNGRVFGGGKALCNAQNLPHFFCLAVVAEHAAPSGAKDVEPKVHGKIQEKTQERSSKIWLLRRG